MAGTLNGKELFTNKLPTWLNDNMNLIQRDVQLYENALVTLKKEEDVIRLQLSKAKLALHHFQQIQKGLEQPTQVYFSADIEHKVPES